MRLNQRRARLENVQHNTRGGHKQPGLDAARRCLPPTRVRRLYCLRYYRSAIPKRAIGQMQYQLGPADMSASRP